MDRHIPFERLHNFRDLGGYPAAGGRRVRWGRLYRSDSLGKLSGADWDRFLTLGIRTVIDLRYPWEAAVAGRVPEHDGLDYHNICVEHRPYEQAELGPEVEVARYLADRYGEVAHDGAAELRKALGVIAAAGAAPLVIHCASGKDRTGLLVALVLTLLGVGEADIGRDYALTERAREKLVGEWLSVHPGQTPTWPGFGRAPAEVMRTFLADMTAAYGSLRHYAVARLGVDDALIEALRRQLLTGSGYGGERV